jgi:hypothetical protein
MRDRSVAGRSALIGAIALLLGACGGSDDGSTVTVTDTAPPPGRAAYIAEADALCARVATEAGDLAESAEELRSIQSRIPVSTPPPQRISNGSWRSPRVLAASSPRSSRPSRTGIGSTSSTR